jgi:ADP-heptose:LPS heptosyltransferase
LIPQASALEWAEQELEKKSIAEFVAIHPGASCPSKIWPLKNFLSLSKRIIQNTNFKIIFLLGPEEIELEDKIRRSLEEGAIVYSNLSLSYLIALISKASLMISNDSGPMHIADALSKPVIAIFGRNQPGLSFTRWGPLGKDAVVIHKEVGCEKCLAHNCKKNFLCLQEITSEEVYAKFEEMLELIK